jgi:aryl-alcohol dehydrogenase-like predicted oxidoreductase
VALAIAWVLAPPGVTGAIAGARRPEQADSWLAGAGLELDDEELDEIERAIAETGAGTTEPPSPPGVSRERRDSVLAGIPSD